MNNNTRNQTSGGGGQRRTAASTTGNGTGRNTSTTNGSATGNGTGTNTSTSTGARIAEAARRTAGPAVDLITAGVNALTSDTNFDNSPAKPVAKKLAQTLGDTRYAIIGACALGLLDINIKRPVQDVEVFVPTGQTAKTATALCAPPNNGFKSSSSTGKLRVWYEKDGNKVPIRFREPAWLQQDYPNANGFFMVGKVRVLKASLLLNIRCYSWSQQTTASGKDQDAADIDHLLKYIALQTKEELPHATPMFLVKFAASKPIVQAGFRYIGTPLATTAQMSSHVPEVLMKKVDEYVDSLAPQIQPRITQELDLFQQKTIDSLEGQVVDAFRSLFNKNQASTGGPAGASRGLNDRVPDAYGGQSLPFADEIADLTRSFTNIAGGAGDDLRDIFNLTENREAPSETRSRGSEPNDNLNVRGFLSAAVHAVQNHLEVSKGSERPTFQLDGLLGVLSDTVKDAARNPEEKARLISPEIKEKVGAKLREQHTPIAEQFTRIALDHIKRWLRGNTSTRDLGDGVKGEIEDQVKDLVKGLGGLFGHKKHPSQGTSRGLEDHDRDAGDKENGGGFSKVISEKISTGLARVHREVRLEFRKILGGIEKQLFELLPDQFQKPLEKILGGNPFDSQLDRDAQPHADRGFGDDIKAKLVNKIRGLVRKVQETLRGSILGVVNGGHRKFERESWVFVQNMVEQKVQKYLPKVKISVPDDIGNEGVSVGAPNSNIQLGGGHQANPPPGGNHPPPQRSHSPPSHGNYPPPPPPPGNHSSPHGNYPPPPHGNHSSAHGNYPPPPHGGYPPPPPPSHHREYNTAPQQEYRPQHYQPQQEYQPNHYHPRPQQHLQQHQADHHAQPDGYQPQPHQQNQQHGQNPAY
ncbi:hypothetical protein F5144DRAFT_489988 [Chaetomium tenue]|uniref:Uncharacterized protein n=1 Tax=Chaetomium tenue TaxID=1854479 RepID=A0ACB7P952_9PEZI|nr:hypothetical protein F5144DRAFT_489988 [Chaetomium globosum]